MPTDVSSARPDRAAEPQDDLTRLTAALQRRVDDLLALIDSLPEHDRRAPFLAVHTRANREVMNAAAAGQFAEPAVVLATRIASSDLVIAAHVEHLVRHDAPPAWQVTLDALVQQADRYDPAQAVMLGYGVFHDLVVPQALLASHPDGQLLAAAAADDPESVPWVADRRRLDQLLVDTLKRPADADPPPVADDIRLPLRLALRHLQGVARAGAVVTTATLAAARTAGPAELAAALDRLDEAAASRADALLEPGPVAPRLTVRPALSLVRV